MILLNHNSGRKLCLYILTALQVVNFVGGFMSYDKRDLHKINVDTTRNKYTEHIRNKYVLKTSSLPRGIVNNSVTVSPLYKKWQVGRVSRKQYEIINMLWRKTKEFVDIDASSGSTKDNYRSTQHILPISARFHQTLATTPSFIEFYYLNDMAEVFKRKNRKYLLPEDETTRESRNNYGLNSGTKEYPIFAFHIGPNYVPFAVPIKQSRPNDDSKPNIGLLHHDVNLAPKPGTLRDQFHLPKVTLKQYEKSTPINHLVGNIAPNVSQGSFDSKLSAYTRKAGNKDTIANNLNTNSFEVKSTIAYDRIKFFELYDKNTPIIYDEESKFINLDERVTNSNKFNTTYETLLRHVDQELDTPVGKKIKAKVSKKHIAENNNNNFQDIFNLKRVHNPVQSLNTTVVQKSNATTFHSPILLISETTQPIWNLTSKVADWSDYSFMAAYIFEPSQVHCDAAGISPHWLVTAGSCLSRHHKNPGGEGRSAFVTYCGSFWWAAERVTYVKYSVVHPSFHQRDHKRRHMYNIGLIQVVTSMDTCPGWSPVSLMSHRFVTEAEGTVGYAIGWGLDRYDIQYSAADLPKLPLMKFESKVYSDSCPGNYGYLHAKQLHEGGGVKNLYCVLLPPYSGEERDLIHGSMLIIGGKLCAIYLQEERRYSGEQSGLYAGVWRLGPWVTDVAREADDNESFGIAV